MQTQKDNQPGPVITSMEQIQNAIDRINAGDGNKELRTIAGTAIAKGWIKPETKLVWDKQNECAQSLNPNRNKWLMDFINMRDAAIAAVNSVLKSTPHWEMKIDNDSAKPIFWLFIDTTSINWFDLQSIEVARKESFPAMNPAYISETPRKFGIRLCFAFIPDTDPNEPPAF